MSEKLLPAEALADLEHLVQKYGMAATVNGLAHVSRLVATNLEKLSELISDARDKKAAKRLAKQFSLYADGAVGLARCLRYILDVS